MKVNNYLAFIISFVIERFICFAKNIIKQNKFPAICTLLLLVIIFSCSSGSGDSDPITKDPDVTERIFYVDPVSGDDANDGQSETNAWKSLDKVNTFILEAGDTVKFKRASVFTGGLVLTASGSSDNPITFDAYGTGEKPVFLGSHTENGWSNLSGSIYQKTLEYTPGKTGAGIVLEDGEPLSFRAWNTDAATSLGSDSGVFTYDPKDLFSSVIYLRCTDSADPSTHEISVGYHLTGIHSEGVSNISINNIIFRNYSLHGISLRNSHNINVTKCTAENIGGAALAVSPAIIYAGNGFEFTLNSTDCSVTDSSALNIFDSGFSPQVFESSTATKNVKFVNCYAEKCGFAGIEISVLKYGTTSDENIENVIVSGCTVYKSGKGWSGRRYGNEGHGIRVKADEGAGSISGVSITQSTVSGCEGSGIFIAGESGTVDVSRCFISENMDNGITCFDDKPNSSLKLRLAASLISGHTGSSSGIRYSVINGNGMSLINNTFSENIVAIMFGDCGGLVQLTNNIFYSTGVTAYLYAASPPSNVQSDYNCFYEHGGVSIFTWSATYQLVSDFSSTSGLDQHSIGYDPLFAGSDNFHLQSASPCKNSGTPAGVSIDYEGNNYASPPSRGAFR